MLWSIPQAHPQQFRPLPFEGVVGGFPSEAVGWGPSGCQLPRTVCLTSLNASTLRTGTLQVLLVARHTKYGPITHLLEEGRTLLLFLTCKWKPVLSAVGTKKQNMVHEVYFQKRKPANDRIPKNWHGCLPFKESNTENISNNKRKSGRIVT